MNNSNFKICYPTPKHINRQARFPSIQLFTHPSVTAVDLSSFQIYMFLHPAAAAVFAPSTLQKLPERLLIRTGDNWTSEGGQLDMKKPKI